MLPRLYDFFFQPKPNICLFPSKEKIEDALNISNGNLIDVCQFVNDIELQFKHETPPNVFDLIRSKNDSLKYFLIN